jgi:hypothetical protein
VKLRVLSDSDSSGSMLDWSMFQHNQIWQAVREPYLCTIVRSLEDNGGFYVTIVRSGDLAIIVLEYAATLDAAQAWCIDQIDGLGSQ